MAKLSSSLGNPLKGRRGGVGNRVEVVKTKNPKPTSKHYSRKNRSVLNQGKPW